MVKVPFSNLDEFFENGEYKFAIYRGALIEVLVIDKVVCAKTKTNNAKLIYKSLSVEDL